MVGAEALVRLWEGERLLYPKEFIPLAEYLRLILPIGEYILEQVVQTLGKMPENKDFFIEVNLSEAQMNQPDILKRMEQLLAPIQSRRVAISITESMAVEHPERAFLVCTQLQKMGMRVALREFGGGKSSFLRLSEMPMDAINLSVLFMEKLETSREFVDLLIKLSHAGHKTVRLNGIQTKAQLAYAQTSGGDQMMGNQLHKETNQAELIRLLQEDEREGGAKA